MKVKIPKYSGGAGILVDYILDAPTPTAGAVSQGSVAQAQTAKKESVIDDDLLKMLRENSLPSDAKVILKKIQNLEYADNQWLTPGNLKSGIYQITNDIISAKHNFDRYKEAMVTAKEKNSLGDVAIGESGELFYKDNNGSLAVTTLENYKKNKDNINLLTVGELSDERAENSMLAFNSNVTNAIRSTAGITKVHEVISQLRYALQNFSDETEGVYTKQQYLNKKATEIARITGKMPNEEELQQLIKMVNVPDYFKETTSVSGMGKNLSVVSNYLLTSIGQAGRHRMNVEAEMLGSNLGDYVNSIVSNLTARSTVHKIDPLEDPALKAKKDSEDKVTPKDLSVFEIQNNGKTMAENIVWNDPGTGLKMNLVGNYLSIWDNITNKSRMGMGSVNTLLNTHTGALLKGGEVYFGDKKVGLNEKENLIVDPSSGTARVYFPVNDDGSPNYDVMKDIQQLIKEAPQNIPPEELTKYFKSKGYDYVSFDKNFQMIPNQNIKPFLLSYAYTDERSDLVKENKEIRELSGPQENEVETVLSGIYDAKKMGKPTGVFKFNFSNTYYKGNILIPYQEDSSIIAAGLSGNILDRQKTISEVKVEQEVANANRNLVMGSDLLNNK